MVFARFSGLGIESAESAPELISCMALSPGRRPLTPCAVSPWRRPLTPLCSPLGFFCFFFFVFSKSIAFMMRCIRQALAQRSLELRWITTVPWRVSVFGFGRARFLGVSLSGWAERCRSWLEEA